MDLRGFSPDPYGGIRAMTAPASPPPKRTGSLRMIEKFTGGTNVVIHTAGKNDKDPEVKNRTFAIASDKLGLIKDIDPKTLPVDVEFTADGKSFITYLRPLASPAAAAANPGTPPSTNGGTTVKPDPANSTSPPPGQAALSGGEKKNGGAQATLQGNGSSGKTPDPGKDDARRDPAWTNHVDKEDWLRYIASTNTAIALLESVWQPDPAKPQAENIADKIEWVRSISSGIRAHYAKEKGGAP